MVRPRPRQPLGGAIQPRKAALAQSPVPQAALRCRPREARRAAHRARRRQTGPGTRSRSAAQFNPEKLRWLNHQYLKQRSDADLAKLVAPRIERDGGKLGPGPDLSAVVGLLKERSETLNQLAEQAMMFYGESKSTREQLEQSLTAEVRAALAELAAKFSAIRDWNAEAVM